VGKKQTARQVAQASQRRLGEFLSVIEQRFKEVEGKIGILHQNQATLATSELKLDEQFAALSRIAVGMLNDLIRAYNGLASELHLRGIGTPERFPTHIPELTYQGFNRVFADFEALRVRPDFKDHYELWFMGGDLSKLPPLPVPEDKELAEVRAELEKADQSTESNIIPVSGEDLGIPDGAQVFGGDLGSSKEQEDDGSKSRDTPEEAQAERGPPAAVSLSGVQEADDAEDRPPVEEAGAVLPAM
jgi:hypothetical protein